LIAGDLRAAERIYVDQGNLEAEIQMYINRTSWLSGLYDLKEKQMSYLLATNEEEKTGEVLEERDKALTLYMKERAAKLALKTPSLIQNEI
jgi:intraflagellar transport protein 172